MIKKRFITGLKIWLVLLLGGLVLLPVTILKAIYASAQYEQKIFVVLLVSIFATFFVYGWLFTKFKKWIFK